MAQKHWSLFKEQFINFKDKGKNVADLCRRGEWLIDLIDKVLRLFWACGYADSQIFNCMYEIWVVIYKVLSRRLYLWDQIEGKCRFPVWISQETLLPFEETYICKGIYNWKAFYNCGDVQGGTGWGGGIQHRVTFCWRGWNSRAGYFPCHYPALVSPNIFG